MIRWLDLYGAMFPLISHYRYKKLPSYLCDVFSFIPTVYERVRLNVMFNILQSLKSCRLKKSIFHFIEQGITTANSDLRRVKSPVFESTPWANPDVTQIYNFVWKLRIRVQSF